MADMKDSDMREMYRKERDKADEKRKEQKKLIAVNFKKLQD